MRNERANADEGKIIHLIVWLIWASAWYMVNSINIVLIKQLILVCFIT